MNDRTRAKPGSAPSFTPVHPGLLQRKCACGGTPGLGGGECAECRKKRLGLQVHAVDPRPLDLDTRAFVEPHSGHDFGRVRVHAPRGMQPKLAVGRPGDRYEDEADRLAEEVVHMPNPDVEQVPKWHAGKEGRNAVDRTAGSVGQPLQESVRAFVEPRFGQDFGKVRIHTDAHAAESARSVGALAYAVGRDVVFGTGQYRPETRSGMRLLAHELTHVVQQGGAGTDRARALSPVTEPRIQRTLGDGHDLTSPRFSRLLDLEAAYDNETVIRDGSSGRGVQAIQQVLYDLGYPLPTSGADGSFGSETKAAVKQFQRDNAPLVDDGEVGEQTMAALDARFGAPALPAAAARSAPWTPSCVRSILCPWSPHTIEVLRTRITLKSFDSITWDDEEWNGASWVAAPFPGGGYNTGVEIGVLNQSCEKMAETLYHEVLHAEQPARHTTTLQSEAYAYRIGEEFSIALGLGGDPTLRSTDVQGREFADPAKVGTFVSTAYPSVPAGGGGDQIVGKAAAPGHVRVQRPNGSFYDRPAAVGEKVPGPRRVVAPATHPTAGWTCP